MSDETKPRVREAARARMPLGGPDAQALEGALQQVERELAAATQRLQAAEGLVRRWLRTAWHEEEYRLVNDSRTFLAGTSPGAPLDPALELASATIRDLEARLATPAVTMTTTTASLPAEPPGTAPAAPVSEPCETCGGERTVSAGVAADWLTPMFKPCPTCTPKR